MVKDHNTAEFNDKPFDKTAERVETHVDRRVDDYDYTTDRVDHTYVRHPNHPVGALHDSHHTVGDNLSWRAILAGLVTFIALNILLSLIAAAIGLGVPDVSAAQPLEGLGSGLLIWTIFQLVASLAAAGYVAGYLANRAGFMHGFLTWALGLIAATYLASTALTGAFNTFGTMLGMTGEAVGNVAGTVTDTAGSLSQDAFNAITDSLKVDTTNLDKDVQNALKDSDIEVLQPNYLQGQLDDTVKDIQDAAKQVVVDRKPVDEALKAVYEKIDQRVTAMGEGLDENELKDAIAKNTDLNQQQADEAVKNIKESYGQAQEQAKQALSDAKTQMEELQTDAGQAVEDAKETTDDVMNEASKYSIYAFIGSLLGMLLSSYAGSLGAKKGQEVENDRVLSLSDEVVVK